MGARAAIIGASGFTGAELLRLLAGHPDLEVVVAIGDTQAGVPIADLFPSLAPAYADTVLQPYTPGLVDGVDVAFLGLPHQASMSLAPDLVGKVGCVVDLSAAFRLRDATLYPQWYGFDHDQPDLLAEAVYGLPERHRAELLGARLIATPGCYVTAATLALAPLLDAGSVEPNGIVVDAASGVSGAGRSPTPTNAFCTVDENFTAYGLLDHRHTPEIEQNLGAEVLFTPHLAPMNRGILATCYARPAVGTATSTAALLDQLGAAYADEPFVTVTPTSPSTKATLGSNSAHLTARYDERTGWIVVICALDNLTKGAAGGALQSANVALGFDETAGLPTVGLAP
ncbi:MAG: N-acetyl-gamma-glutamyl-phosphate reductase [Ilumatobacteraceae bacterium]